jgi:energy-coupling factor transporter transmembrane protein EcfT
VEGARMNGRGRRVPVIAAGIGLAAIALAFLRYYTADSVGTWFLLMPIALLAGLVAVVTALRRRGSSVALGAGAVGLLAAAFAAWTVFGLAEFMLTCAGVIESSHC